MKKLSKKDWLQRLSEGLWEIEFETVRNGEIETMSVTLDKTRIPKGEHKRIANADWWAGDNAVTCWSTDREGWRAFRPENVRSCSQL